MQTSHGSFHIRLKRQAVLPIPSVSAIILWTVCLLYLLNTHNANATDWTGLRIAVQQLALSNEIDRSHQRFVSQTDLDFVLNYSRIIQHMRGDEAGYAHLYTLLDATKSPLNRENSDELVKILASINEAEFYLPSIVKNEQRPLETLLYSHIPYREHGVNTHETIADHLIEFMQAWGLLETLGVIDYEAVNVLRPTLHHFPMIHSRDDVKPPCYDIAFRWYALTHDLTKYYTIVKNRQEAIAQGIENPAPDSRGQEKDRTMLVSELGGRLNMDLWAQYLADHLGEVSFGDIFKAHTREGFSGKISRGDLRDIEQALVAEAVEAQEMTKAHAWVVFRARLANWLADIASHHELNRHLNDWGRYKLQTETHRGVRRLFTQRDKLTDVLGAIHRADVRLRDPHVTGSFYYHYPRYVGLRY